MKSRSIGSHHNHHHSRASGAGEGNCHGKHEISDDGESKAGKSKYDKDLFEPSGRGLPPGQAKTLASEPTEAQRAADPQPASDPLTQVLSAGGQILDALLGTDASEPPPPPPMPELALPEPVTRTGDDSGRGIRTKHSATDIAY